MRRKNTLSEADKFYIESHRSKSVAELSEATGASKAAISEWFRATEEAKRILTTPQEPATIPAEQTATGVAVAPAVPAVNPENGVTVMTPAAGQWMDEMKNRAQTGPSYLERNQDRIATIRK